MSGGLSAAVEVLKPLCKEHDVGYSQQGFVSPSGYPCVNHHFVVWSKRSSAKEAIVMATPIGLTWDGEKGVRITRLHSCSWDRVYV